MPCQLKIKNKFNQFTESRKILLKQMQQLKQLGYQVRPINRNNLDQVLEFIKQGFNENPIILDKIQTVQELNNNTRKVFQFVLQAEEDFNKNRKTPVFFCAVYVKDGKIQACTLTCDLVYYLKMVDNIKGDILLEPFKHIDRSKIKIGQDSYTGKTVISKSLQGQKLMRLVQKQRMEYLYKHGYKYQYGIASNKKTRSVALGFGSVQLDNSIYTLPNGRKLQMSILVNKMDDQLNYKSVNQSPLPKL